LIGGLVLAAGAGTRFGASRGSKLLAPLEGRPLLEHAVAAPCAVGALERVVVVLGSRAEAIRAGADLGRAETVMCHDWQRGQAFSLRCGAAALAGCERVIVTLGDVPGITPEVIERFVAAPPRARATYGGRPGHPVVLGPDELTALAALHGDAGARELLRGGPLIECGAIARGADVDTPEDLEAIRDEARAVI
jgi:CTP:molybdopterin cytidylyltransferase MocA